MARCRGGDPDRHHAAGGWFLSDLLLPETPSVFALTWNTFKRLLVFLLLALLTARVRRDRETLARSNQALHTLAEREAALARLDPLTGLLNARAFRDALSTELTLARAR